MPPISINQIKLNPSPQAMGRAASLSNGLPWISILLLLTGLVTAFLAYVLLPQAGIDTFKHLLGLKKLLAIALLPVLASGYLLYWQQIQKHPILLIMFMAIFWMPLSFLNEQLLIQGINLHLRALLIATIALPSLWILLNHGRIVIKQLPFFKWLVFFFMALTLYFIFNNASNISEGFGLSHQSSASVGLMQYESYFYCLIAAGLSAWVLFKQPVKSIKLFDQFNVLYLSVSLIIALITIIGYPLEATSMMLDGFRRAFGLFTHPNPYAHSMGIQVLYITGLLLYYSVRNRNKHYQPMSIALVWFSLAINTIAFLLAISKTAIAFVLLSGIAFILFNLGSHSVKQSLSKILLATIILLPIALIAYSLVTGQSFTEVIQSRMEETTSMDWRSEVWEYIIENLSIDQLLMGNGFTASNMLIYQMTYHNIYNNKPLIMVHNGYLSLLYDMGMMGLSLFVAVSSCLFSAIRNLKNNTPESKVLLSTAIALSIYFLCVSGFDEMTYMFNAPLLFWIFASSVYTMSKIHHCASRETSHV